MVKRFDVYLIALDPTLGSEIKKTMPCLIISPDEMHWLNTVIIAPMTTSCKSYPTRIPVTFSRKKGYIVLDQIRTVDKSRLVQFLGTIDKKTASSVLQTLHELFA